ncbi:short-chain dehydrogenase [Pseudomonas aeruginosa]|nr:short-chain dehydrogenase [Pseudomonas aeruginosa]
MAIPPIWRLGFRPFFLGGALFAVLAIALWLAALAGLWSGWQPVGGWLAWHRHEMLFGFGVAIIAGFLLTAVQTWTGVPGLQGKPLALLAGLWLAARLAWLFDAPLALLLVLQLSFLPLLAWAIGRSLWRVRQKRNYPVVGLLLLLTLADALVLLGLFEGNDDWQRRASIAALWLIAGMMNLIGGRVIPFFTQRGLGRQQQVPAIAWLDNGILLGCVLVALLTAAGVTTQPTPWLAGLFAALGGAQLWRLWRWRDRGIWQVPLLWSLHLAYFWIAVAPLGMALWSLGLALAPLAYARGASLALESAGPVWIQGEPTLLNELLSNLLDNALAHTPQGGNVILRVLEGGVLEVEDDGPGIPAADRERVFQRFYRRGDSPGSGLGLAIVGEVCRAHRAQIQLDQGELGGLLVRVRFPAE